MSNPSLSPCRSHALTALSARCPSYHGAVTYPLVSIPAKVFHPLPGCFWSKNIRSELHNPTHHTHSHWLMLLRYLSVTASFTELVQQHSYCHPTTTPIPSHSMNQRVWVWVSYPDFCDITVIQREATIPAAVVPSVFGDGKTTPTAHTRSFSLATVTPHAPQIQLPAAAVDLHG